MAKTEACNSFAVGHMAFRDLSSKTSSKLLKTNLNIPLALTLSIIPDADIFLQRIPFIQHRRATHSIISAFIVFVPFFIIYRKQAAPYFIALVQHGLVGDFIAGGCVQLFWPVTSTSARAWTSGASQTKLRMDDAPRGVTAHAQDERL